MSVLFASCDYVSSLIQQPFAALVEFCLSYKRHMQSKFAFDRLTPLFSFQARSQTLSVVPSSFSPPAPPDIYDCDKWFASPTNATFDDCVVAFNQLPTDSAPIYWKTTPDPHDPFSLPHTETHGECGELLMAKPITCTSPF